MVTPFEKTVARLSSKAAVVHIAMTIAVVLYAVVTMVLKTQWDEQPAPEAPPAAVFLAVAAGAAAVAMWLRSRLPPADGASAQVWERALEQAEKQDRLLREHLPQMTAEERRLSGFLVHATTRLLIVWAVAESVAIVGMARAILTHDAGQLPPFLAVSLALLLMTSPRLPERLAEARRLSAAAAGAR